MLRTKRPPRSLKGQTVLHPALQTVNDRTTHEAVSMEQVIKRSPNLENDVPKDLIIGLAMEMPSTCDL